jgi:hypothetical protein
MVKGVRAVAAVAEMAVQTVSRSQLEVQFQLAGQIHCKSPELLPQSVVLATQNLSIMVIRV